MRKQDGTLLSLYALLNGYLFPAASSNTGNRTPYVLQNARVGPAVVLRNAYDRQPFLVGHALEKRKSVLAGRTTDLEEGRENRASGEQVRYSYLSTVQFGSARISGARVPGASILLLRRIFLLLNEIQDVKLSDLSIREEAVDGVLLVHEDFEDSRKLG